MGWRERKGRLKRSEEKSSEGEGEQKWRVERESRGRRLRKKERNLISTHHLK